MSVGASVDRKATINICISGGHAYAIIPTSTAQRLHAFSREFKEPQDCPRKCWETYPSTHAAVLHSLVKPSNPTLRGKSLHIPSLGIFIQNFNTMVRSAPALHARSNQVLFRLNKALAAHFKSGLQKTSQIISKAGINYLSGGCIAAAHEIKPSQDIWFPRANTTAILEAIGHAPVLLQR